MGKGAIITVASICTTQDLQHNEEILTSKGRLVTKIAVASRLRGGKEPARNVSRPSSPKYMKLKERLMSLLVVQLDIMDIEKQIKPCGHRRASRLWEKLATAAESYIYR
jgi:hypothetical protein